MKHVNFNSMQEIGVHPLTGEADAFCMRLLCDLNKTGVEMMLAFLGMKPDTQLAKNWNSMVDNEPAVASIMLTRETLWGYAKFFLFMEGYEYIIEQPYGLYALQADEEQTAGYLRLCEAPGSEFKLLRNPTSHSKQPRMGGRNIHAMTGRTL